MNGKIVSYNSAKEYGFVRADGAETDTFFHLSQFDGDGDPAVDSRVAFQIEDDPQKPGRQRARTVVPVE